MLWIATVDPIRRFKHHVGPPLRKTFFLPGLFFANNFFQLQQKKSEQPHMKMQISRYRITQPPRPCQKEAASGLSTNIGELSMHLPARLSPCGRSTVFGSADEACLSELL